MNLAEIIERHPDETPALVGASGAVVTYGQLRRAVPALQQRLLDAGIGADDRVAIVSANDPAFVVAYLATLRAGAVAVPLNVVSPTAELQRQLAEVDVAAILIGPGGEHVARALPSSAATPMMTIAAGEAGIVATETAAAPPEPVERGAEDLAALLFTAGTAGAPRAAMLTHGNLLANLDQIRRHPGPGIQGSDRVLAVLPLCHIFGLNAVLGEALLVGASVLLLDRFDPARTLELIAEHGVTVLVGAPNLFAALMAVPPATGEAMGSVRFAFSGAAPLSSEVADGWEKRFGFPLRQGYGLTEASPVVTAAVMDEPARPSSIGIPLPGVDVRLVDTDGEEALAGDPGEIWVRGPNVFPGYWNDTDATTAALTTDGWLRTGDIAVVGDDGELAIVDRAKDLIIVSGFNVFPAEVEEALAEHPGVAEVAVIGDVDPRRGEVVHAFVVRAGAEAAEPTGAELADWCRARLARYKCPTEFTFVPSLPHGLAGKLLRRSLRSATPEQA